MRDAWLASLSITARECRDLRAGNAQEPTPSTTATIRDAWLASLSRSSDGGLQGDIAEELTPPPSPASRRSSVKERLSAASDRLKRFSVNRILHPKPPPPESQIPILLC